MFRCTIPYLLLSARPCEAFELRAPNKFAISSQRCQSAIPQQLVGGIGPLVAAAVFALAPVHAALPEVEASATANVALAGVTDRSPTSAALPGHTESPQANAVMPGVADSPRASDAASLDAQLSMLLQEGRAHVQEDAAARVQIARAASARAADAQKALASGLSFAGKSLASAAQTAKEIATAEETMLALETMRKAAIEAAEAAKELAAAEETKQALDSARRATLKALEVASTKAQRVMEAEETQKALKALQRKAQENAQVLQKEVERTATEGLRLVSAEASKAFDNSPVDEKTKQEIRRRAEEAARVADAVAKELGKAAKAGDEFIKSKETQQALAEARRRGSYAFGYISKSISSALAPKDTSTSGMTVTLPSSAD
ncbi:hypothetical protein AB1Y20_018745 [Prymnesium parvum]|uniref:Uncharacterized protein n=1 Tax=Prymnesium parvum TaxID=97485 RepID=A0AB34JSM7_PRYPA